MKVTEPSTEKEWQAYYNCRYLTLREPWGQPRGSEKADDDPESIHAMATEQGEVCGVARLHFVDPETMQIRFMGVDARWRRKGIGKKLLRYLEEKGKEKGGKTIILHAREKAIPFYLECGYEVREKSHLLWGAIQHYEMYKQID